MTATWLLVPQVLQAADSAPILEQGAERSFAVRLEPGTLYAINFVSGKKGSEVVAEFSTGGPGVFAMAIVHPRSDLVEQGGKVDVQCPGLGQHALKVSGTRTALPSGRIASRSSERGHFGFAFKNPTALALELRVVVKAVRSSIAFAAVGSHPGNVIQENPASREPVR